MEIPYRRTSFYNKLRKAFRSVYFTEYSYQDTTPLIMANPIETKENILWKEWRLLKYYFLRLFIAIVFSVYLCDIVARRLAYLMHYPISHYVQEEDENLVRIPRLEDLGHKMLPDWSENEFITALNEVIQAVAFINAIVFFLIMFFYEKRISKGIFVVNIFVRVIYCFATLSLIRTVCYLSTSLPGPAAHCIDPSVEEENKPQGIADIFLPGNVLENCGDLIYSGHMAAITTIFCTIIYYFNKLVEVDEEHKKTWCIFCRPISVIILTLLSVIVTLLQGIMTISARQHYTVDAFLGVIIGYWNFIWHLYVLRPDDMIL